MIHWRFRKCKYRVERGINRCPDFGYMLTGRFWSILVGVMGDFGQGATL